MNAQQAIARTLRAYRERAGLTMGQLQEASGVSKAIISKTENGTKMPTAKTLSRLAAALHVDASELLTAAGYTADRAEALPTLPAYLRSKYGHLSAADRREVAELLQRLEAEHGTKK